VSELRAAIGPARWFLAFAAAVFVFHQLPAFAGAPIADGIDLLAAAVLLGWTFFTSTVEGQTWPLDLAAAALFGRARFAPDGVARRTGRC